MDKDKFNAKDRVKELSPKEMQIIDSVMGNPRLYIDAYNGLSRSIYPGIDRKRKKQKQLKKIWIRQT